jgi:hypothetical protein
LIYYFQHGSYEPFAAWVRAFVHEEKKQQAIFTIVPQAIRTVTDYLPLINARNEANIDKLEAKLKTVIDYQFSQ